MYFINNRICDLWKRDLQRKFETFFDSKGTIRPRAERYDEVFSSPRVDIRTLEKSTFRDFLFWDNQIFRNLLVFKFSSVTVDTVWWIFFLRDSDRILIVSIEIIYSTNRKGFSLKVVYRCDND